MAPPNPTSHHVDIRRVPTGTNPFDAAAHPFGSARSARAGLDYPNTAGTPLALATSTAPSGEMLVIAEGEIDLCTGPTFLSCLQRAMRHPSCRTLIVDLRQVRFLGALGITALMTITLDSHTHDVRLALVADHATVLRPLQITNTANRLQLFPTHNAARDPDRPLHPIAMSPAASSHARPPEGTP